jgi:hypothetical protein
MWIGENAHSSSLLSMCQRPDWNFKHTMFKSLAYKNMFHYQVYPKKCTILRLCKLPEQTFFGLHTEWQCVSKTMISQRIPRDREVTLSMHMMVFPRTKEKEEAWDPAPGFKKMWTFVMNDEWVSMLEGHRFLLYN